MGAGQALSHSLSALPMAVWRPAEPRLPRVQTSQWPGAVRSPLRFVAVQRPFSPRRRPAPPPPPPRPVA